MMGTPAAGPPGVERLWSPNESWQATRCEMAGSINKVILIGRLGKDPEVRSFQNGGKVVNFTLATSETWNDRASGERKEKTD